MTKKVRFGSSLIVEFEKLADVDSACRHFEPLQEYRSSVFLSLGWIGPWVSTIGNDVDLYLLNFIGEKNKIVGSALLARTQVHRRKLFNIDTLSLNEVEAEGAKFIIEYNNILHHPEYREDIYYSFFDFLANSPIQFDELKLNAIDVNHAADVSELCAQFNLNFIEEESSRAYFTDLAQFDSDPARYIQKLSKNKREQVRRSIKFYRQFGTEEIRLASDQHEALQFFDNMGVFHQEYWKGKGCSGSFANDKWVRFHKDIIINYFHHVQLVRISFGEHVLGYLYNLVDRDVAYSMQSGFNYSSNKHDRPGIIAHILITNYYIQNSMLRYEYLAGESRYKQSLSTSYNTLKWYSVQRKSAKLFIENFTLKCVRSMKKYVSS